MTDRSDVVNNATLGATTPPRRKTGPHYLYSKDDDLTLICFVLVMSAYIHNKGNRLWMDAVKLGILQGKDRPPRTWSSMWDRWTKRVCIAERLTNKYGVHAALTKPLQGHETPITDEVERERLKFAAGHAHLLSTPVRQMLEKQLSVGGLPPLQAQHKNALESLRVDYMTDSEEDQ